MRSGRAKNLPEGCQAAYADTGELIVSDLPTLYRDATPAIRDSLGLARADDPVDIAQVHSRIGCKVIHLHASIAANSHLHVRHPEDFMRRLKAQHTKCSPDGSQLADRTALTLSDRNVTLLVSCTLITLTSRSLLISCCRTAGGVGHSLADDCDALTLLVDAHPSDRHRRRARQEAGVPIIGIRKDPRYVVCASGDQIRRLICQLVTSWKIRTARG